MADFRNYACWTRAGAAALPVEAVVPSQAFFFATHAPLTIYQASNMGVRSDPPARPVNEQAVYDDLLSTEDRGGTLLLPVIGESGTGKSHLVRWVWEKLKAERSERFQVIYLPKTKTSLRGVVEALLAEVDDSELDRLRKRVNQATTELDQQGLEERLLNQLQEAFVAAEPEKGKPKTRVLTGKAGLAVLLQDPYVRSYLVRGDAFIPKLAASLLKDRAEEEPDRKAEFTLDDLPVTDIDDVKKTAEPTQRLYKHLIADAELQVLAVQMLNKYLPKAVLEAGNIGVGRLQEAMMQVRRKFAEVGKEIILLIEDFAVIQGVQKDLLDAIIQVGQVEGTNDYATIRTLMAVTTGYYRGIAETVQTRVPHVYDLDVQFNPDSGMEDMASFVGRYLNAARVGVSELNERWKRDSSTTPNACTGCKFREECHADDAFGKSHEGYGLYPFNKAALRRVIQSRRPPGDRGDAFNPRLVIDKVVRNVLLEYRSPLTEGQFPDEAFKAEYSDAEVDTVVSADLEESINSRMGKTEGLRYVTLLNFWAAADSERANVLSPVIYEAFDMRAEDIADILSRTESSSGPGKKGGAVHRERGPDTVKSPGPPVELQRKLAAIDAWSQRGQELGSDLARDLRTITRDAVIQRSSWNDPLVPTPSIGRLREIWPARAYVVSIDGAYGNQAATDDTPIRFTRSSENAVFFKGLLLANSGAITTQPWATESDVGRAARAMRQLARKAELHEKDLVAAVLSAEDITEDQLALGIRASLIGATLAGKARPDMQEADLLVVVFDEGKEWNRADAAMCDPKWADRLQKHLAARPVLVGKLRAGLGISRGSTGGVRMIDAARALPMLRAAVQSWAWETPSITPAAWIKNAVTGFGDWESLIEAQLIVLEAHLTKIRARLPEGKTLGETIKAVEAAIAAVTASGVDPLDTGQSQVRQAQLDSLAHRNPNAVQNLHREIARARQSEDPAEGHRMRIIATARDRGTDITTISQFLADSEKWLMAALETAKNQQGGTADVAAAQVRSLQSDWAAVTGQGRG